MQKALRNPYHGLNRAARAVNRQNNRHDRAMRVALNDKTHPFHKAAKAHLKGKQDDMIKKAHPDHVKQILSDPSHPLHKAAKRVTSAQEKEKEKAKPKYEGMHDLPGYSGWTLKC